MSSNFFLSLSLHFFHQAYRKEQTGRHEKVGRKVKKNISIQHEDENDENYLFFHGISVNKRKEIKF